MACCCSQRWVLAYIGTICLTFFYAMRTNFSMAILCMDKDENKTEMSTSNLSTVIINGENNENGKMSAGFDWSRATQSSLLTAFYYGYLLTQIPGGWLADRFGGKRVVGIALFIASVSTILLPILARTSVLLVFALRVVLGLACGTILPAMQSLWGRWAPPLERSKLLALTYSGMPIGIVLSLSTAGLLCGYDSKQGWSYIFYSTGIPPLLLVLLWFYLTADLPSKHPRITEMEREYIEGVLEYDTTKKITEVPWLPLFKSKAVWAMTIAHSCVNWTEYTLLTSLPIFMEEVFHLDYTTNGVLSAVPFIFYGLFGLMSGQAADFIRSKHWLNTTNTRKTFQITSFIGTSAFLIAMGFTADDRTYIITVLLTLAVSFIGITKAGFDVNPVDFAPKYAGVVYAVSNTISSIPGLVAPIVTGALTPNKTQMEWRNVFYVCAGLNVIGILFYGCFASGKLESWAKDEPSVGISNAICSETN